MFSEIKNSKWLIFQLFLRDVKSMYKQSFIGVFWTLIIPFFALGTFIVLNSSGIITLGDINAPYPIFAVLGLAFWQIFSTGINWSKKSFYHESTKVPKHEKKYYIVRGSFKMFNFEVSAYLFKIKEGDPPEAD